jgi:hypothetical protein
MSNLPPATRPGLRKVPQLAPKLLRISGPIPCWQEQCFDRHNSSSPPCHRGAVTLLPIRILFNDADAGEISLKIARQFAGFVEVDHNFVGTGLHALEEGDVGEVVMDKAKGAGEAEFERAGAGANAHEGEVADKVLRTGAATQKGQVTSEVSRIDEITGKGLGVGAVTCVVASTVVVKVEVVGTGVREDPDVFDVADEVVDKVADGITDITVSVNKTTYGDLCVHAVPPAGLARSMGSVPIWV